MADHRLVVKNTLFLYLRMFITIVVTLYTTRVVLNVMGVVDYGIYNVVGGFVSMLTFLTATMSNASTRFFAIELGSKHEQQLKVTFKVTMTVYLFLIIGILILAETIGLWFVCNKLTIPPSQLNAAIIVYQFSILGLILNIIRIPFNAAIIAHEKMDFYAYLSIVEAILKLVIVYLLIISPWNKLAFYSILICCVVGIVTLVYYIYCRKHYLECRFGLDFSKSKINEILRFSGWNLFSNFGDVMMDQGMNILLNIFFGPAINAARALAYNVKSVLLSFIGNFQTASTPQITKHYAANEINEMNQLVVQTSKLSYMLMLILVIPSYFCIDKILHLWLIDVPAYTNIFTKLLLVEVLFMAMGGTLNNAIQAKGHIQPLIIGLSIVKIINFILAFVGLKICILPPEFVFWVCILNSSACMILKIYFYKREFKDVAKSVIKEIIIKEVYTTVVSLSIVGCMAFLFYKPSDVISMIIMSFVSFIITAVCILEIGLTKQERSKTLNLIFRFFK